MLAEHFGDRLFLANAQLGLAEFRQRQRDRTTAQDHAQRALAQFERLRPPTGIGNVASRLADILVHGGQRGRP